MNDSTLVTHLLRLALLGAEWVLWILIGLFAFSIYLISERLITYALLRRALNRYRDGNSQGLMRLVPELKESLDSQPEGEAGRLFRLRRRLQRGLGFLGTLGANAPYIGLFGTVLGIIQAFHQLSQYSGGKGTRLVMIGISEALVATGVGLLVAIPCVFAYNHLLRSSQYLLQELGEVLKSKNPVPSLAPQDLQKDRELYAPQG